MANSRFTYLHAVTVKLDGRAVGTIRELEEGGWQYFPKGSRKGGTIFGTLAQCRLSLESN